MVVAAIDELNANQYIPGRPLYGAFHQRVPVEFASDLRGGLLRPLVAHYRGSRYHVESADLSQAIRQSLSHAHGQVLLIRIAGEVLQGQYRDGANSRCGSAN